MFEFTVSIEDAYSQKYALVVEIFRLHYPPSGKAQVHFVGYVEVPIDWILPGDQKVLSGTEIRHDFFPVKLWAYDPGNGMTTAPSTPYSSPPDSPRELRLELEFNSWSAPNYVKTLEMGHTCVFISKF
jgi:hypothetical protein